MPEPHQITITSNPAGWRWECSCGSRGKRTGIRMDATEGGRAHVRRNT